MKRKKLWNAVVLLFYIFYERYVDYGRHSLLN